jgi:hypothetical protein
MENLFRSDMMASMQLVRVIRFLFEICRRQCVAAACSVLLTLGVHPSAVALAGTAAESSIFVYFSPTTAQYLRSSGQSYERVSRRWPIYLDKFGKDAAEINRNELLTGLNPGVLIVPNAVALDDQERAAIERHVQRGGSLFATGPIGHIDAQGKEVGFAFMERVFRVKTHGYFAGGDNSFFMPFGDGPLTWTIPAMRRMGMANPPNSLLRISGTNEAAVMMNWSRANIEGPIAVMAYDEIGKSRVALLTLCDWAWPMNRDAGTLKDATMAWLRKQPLAFKPAWPNGFSSAHLIEMDTEDLYYSGEFFADQLEKEGLRGTFYSLTSEAIRVPNVVRNLHKRGHEIAYHADVHFGFKNDPAAEQELRIIFMIQQMSSILGASTTIAEVTGFRAPTESYDKTTERLLRKHGILHHAADEAAHEDRLPFFSISEVGVPTDQALVVLPRTQKDDIEFTRMKLSVEETQKILFHDLPLAAKSGSFSLLSVHSQFYIKGGLMYRAMPDYLARVATFKDRMWVARGDEITRWWRERANVRVNHRAQGANVQVDVESVHRTPIKGFAVYVTLPASGAKVTASTSQPGVSLRVKAIDAFRAAVIFGQLPVGKTQLNLSFS